MFCTFAIPVIVMMNGVTTGLPAPMVLYEPSFMICVPGTGTSSASGFVRYEKVDPATINHAMPFTIDAHSSIFMRSQGQRSVLPDNQSSHCLLQSQMIANSSTSYP